MEFDSKGFANTILANVVMLLVAKVGVVRAMQVLRDLQGIMTRLVESPDSLMDTLGEQGWTDYISNGGN